MRPTGVAGRRIAEGRIEERWGEEQKTSTPSSGSRTTFSKLPAGNSGNCSSGALGEPGRSSAEGAQVITFRGWNLMGLVTETYSKMAALSFRPISLPPRNQETLPVVGLRQFGGAKFCSLEKRKTGCVVSPICWAGYNSQNTPPVPGHMDYRDGSSAFLMGLKIGLGSLC